MCKVLTYSANKTSITDSPVRHSALPLHSSVVDLKNPKCDLYDVWCLKIERLVQPVVDSAWCRYRKGKLTANPASHSLTAGNLYTLWGMWAWLARLEQAYTRPMLMIMCYPYKQTHLRACHTMSTWWGGSLPRRTLMPPADSKIIYIIAILTPVKRHRLYSRAGGIPPCSWRYLRGSFSDVGDWWVGGGRGFCKKTTRLEKLYL